MGLLTAGLDPQPTNLSSNSVRSHQHFDFTHTKKYMGIRVDETFFSHCVQVTYNGSLLNPLVLGLHESFCWH